MRRDEIMRKRPGLRFMALGTFLAVASVAGVVKGQDSGNILAPPEGSTFTFQVSVTGDKPATMSLWQEPGERQEVHTFKGLVKGIKGRVGPKTLEDSKPYDCLNWEITRPKDPAFKCEYLYAIVDSTLCCYLERQTSGEEKYYVKPLPLVKFPLNPGESCSNTTTFYLKLPDTGITLAKSYESKGTQKDTIEAEVTIGPKETIQTQAGRFPVTKVTVIFRSHTGRFLTSANTTITMERWWSEKLDYFIKEHDEITMDALIDHKGTIDKELIDFRITS